MRIVQPARVSSRAHTTAVPLTAGLLTVGLQAIDQSADTGRAPQNINSEGASTKNIATAVTQTAAGGPRESAKPYRSNATHPKSAKQTSSPAMTHAHCVWAQTCMPTKLCATHPAHNPTQPCECVGAVVMPESVSMIRRGTIASCGQSHEMADPHAVLPAVTLSQVLSGS